MRWLCLHLSRAGATDAEAAMLCSATFLSIRVDDGQMRELMLDTHSAKGRDAELVRRLSESDRTTFAGLYTHGGHSYDASSPEAVVAIGETERDATAGFAAALRAAGIAVPCVGVGSTPTCARPPPHLDGVDEMHPGNYLYFDMTQARRHARCPR